MAICLAVFGAAAAPAPATGHDQVLSRISNETGVPVHTLRKQEAETGLGFGNLEKANLLANASGHSFREVVSRFKAGEGWGEIAHDADLNLGKIVSEAHQDGREDARDDGDREDRRDGEEARDGRDRDERGDGEVARDERDRDDQGQNEQAREDRDRDDRGHDAEAREDRDRDDRGHGEFARDDGDRDERADANAPTKGQRHVLKRISNQTGVPTRTLRRERAKTGLGFGALEKANLLARATGHSFRRVVSRFRSGEGFGKIAHDAGLKLGKLVSRAHRSDKAAKRVRVAHAQSAHGKSAVARGRSSVHSRATVAHGNSSLHRASAVSDARGQMSRMNGFGHGGFGPVRSGANHGTGHAGGHGGGR